MKQALLRKELSVVPLGKDRENRLTLSNRPSSLFVVVVDEVPDRLNGIVQFLRERQGFAD